MIFSGFYDPLALSMPVWFDQPRWFWLLATIPLIVVISLRSLAGLERAQRITAIVLRCLVILALTLALAGIEFVRRNDQVAVMFVLDRSHSVSEELREKSQSYVQQAARSADRDDRMGVIGVDGEAQVDVIPSRGGLDIPQFGMTLQPDRTDLAAGLRMAMASFPEGFAKRVVLISDGNENMERLADEVEIAAANGVSIDVIPLQFRHDAEIMFDRVAAPAQAGINTEIPVRLIARSKRPVKAKLTLYHNDLEIPLKDPVISLVGDMQANRFDVPVELSSGGVHHFDARLTPLNPSDDAIAQNNRATAFTFVEDKGRVLILTQPRVTDDVPLLEALQREKLDVDLRGVDALSIDLLKLQEYSAVVLANVAADSFNSQQHQALASYVRDFGGGIVMIGGDESFGAGGWIGKPLEEVSPVNFEIKHKRVIPRGALAIVMHSCEIPRGNYWGVQVAMAAANTISSLDYLGVICYSHRMGGPSWDVPMALADDKEGIRRKIHAMENGDMPDFEVLVRQAIQALMTTDAAQRHIIIISDGDPAPPSGTTIQSMISNRITCSTVGIGYGTHVMEAPLRGIAQRTKGRFYPCKNPQTLPQIFIKEAKVVRRGLLDEHAFVPQMLSGVSPMLQGISAEGLRPLNGMVLTQAKADCVLPMVRESKEGTDPLLAHWNYETGKMVVFTSGLWRKWGASWASWEQFGQFWAQIVRWVRRQQASADFDVLTRMDGHRGQVVVEALNHEASFLNFLRISGRLMTPSLEQKPLAFVQTGAGRYEASFEVTEHGNYLMNMEYRAPNRQSGLIRAGLSMPYSQEFRDLASNLALLQNAAQRTGGRVLPGIDPQKEQVFSRNLPPVVSRQPMWRWVVAWVLLPLFILDVAGRRLASVLAMSVYVEVAVFVFMMAVLCTAHGPYHWEMGHEYVTVLKQVLISLLIAEIVGWSIRRRAIRPTVEYLTAGARYLTRTSQRSKESLTQLKDVSERVRQELQSTTPPPEAIRRKDDKQDTSPLEPAPSPKTRFDMGESAGGPAGDLSETLGSAAATKQQAPDQKQADSTQQGPTEDLASRLRKAKRRAQDKLDDRKGDR